MQKGNHFCGVCWAWLLTSFWLGNEMFYFQEVPWLRRRVFPCHLWRTSKAGLAPAWGWRVALLSRSLPSLWWLGVRFVPVCFASKLCKILICLCVLMLLVVGKGTYRNHGQPPVKHARKFCYLIPLGFIFMRLGFLLWKFRLVFPSPFCWFL